MQQNLQPALQKKNSVFRFMTNQRKVQILDFLQTAHQIIVSGVPFSSSSSEQSMQRTFFQLFKDNQALDLKLSRYKKVTWPRLPDHETT